MLTATKKFKFCYGHFLPDYHGKCSAQHGHNSNVEVEFNQLPSGHSLNVYPGMVVDFSEIKELVGPIIDRLDHRNLNDFIRIPTAENITLDLVNEIMKTPLGPYLNRIRMSETDSSFVEWTADNEYQKKLIDYLYQKKEEKDA